MALIQRFNDLEAMPKFTDKQQALSDIMSTLDNVTNGSPPDVKQFFVRLAQRYGWVKVVVTPTKLVPDDET